MRTAAILLSLVSLSLAVAIPEQVGFTANSGEVAGYSLDLNEMRLVEMEGQPARWMTELEKIEARALGAKFFDITETRELGSFSHLRAQNKNKFPHGPNATEVVKPIIKLLKADNMRENLEKFTSFRTRYYRSETGQQSQRWLLSKVQEITKEWATSDLQKHISITEFPHSWGQNSIVARINGTGATDSTVIVGAHQDSTNIWPFLPAPGADDDGSGSTTILEAYRALLEYGFAPSRNVEFHWYSAEEGGLLGSQAIAQAYEQKDADVYAMSQFDMTAWVKKGVPEKVGLINDFVSPELLDFQKKLVDQYLNIGWVETKCGYACSDHASWTKAGYRSAFSIENAFEHTSPHIHSGNDRIDKSDEFSFEHMREFSKLAVAFVVELSS